MIKFLATSLGILAAAIGTVSDIEVLFILIASFGLLYSLFNIREGIRDIYVLRKVNASNTDNYDARVILARSALKAEISRAIIQIIFLSLGVMAAFIPEAPPQFLTLFQQVFSFIFKWGLTLSAGLLAYKSYLTKQTRDLVKSLIS